VTHLSLHDLRKVDQMTEPSVEEIVAQIEEFILDPECDDWQMDNSDFRALIASWRERGEALKAARTFATIQKEEADAHGFPDYAAKELLTVIDAALAAEPASGEEKDVEITALRQRADEATRAAYEECAKIAEQQEQEFLSPEYATDQPLSSFSERFACSQVAAAIRARIKP
jgi:hypothetical protein